MKKNDNIYFRAFGPLSRASADTQYNGTATIGDAVGIPINDSGEVDVQIMIGALNASLTSVAYTLHTSTKSTGATAGDLVAVTGAAVTALPADADSVKVINVKLAAVSNKPSDTLPIYLYVKRVQTGAYAAVDCVSVIATDNHILPKLAIAGTAAYTVVVD